jgi:hypothetical protein
VVDDGRDALEAAKALLPVGGTASSSSARGISATASRAASSGRFGERRKQRRRLRVAPQRRRIERDGGTRFPLAARRRLDLDIAVDAVRARPPRDRREGGSGSPAYCAECHPPASNRDSSRQAMRRRAATARRALERRVVEQERTLSAASFTSNSTILYPCA